MILYLRDLVALAWFAMVHDRARGRRWFRAAVFTLAGSGAYYAEQLEPISHKLAVAVRVLGFLCMFVTAVHGDPVARPGGVAPEGMPVQE